MKMPEPPGREADPERGQSGLQAIGLVEDALLDALPFPSFVCDRAGTVVAASLAFSTLLGRPHAQVVGLPFLRIVTVSDLPEAGRLFRCEAGDTEALRVASCGVVAGGAETTRARVVVRLHKRPDGALYFVGHLEPLGIGHAGAHAQQRIRDLTGRLARAEHDRSQEGAFLGAVQREFRVAVNWLRNCIGQIVEHTADDRQRAVAREAMNWTRSIGALTHELLDFSRLLSGQAVAQATQFDLGAALEALRAQPLPEGEGEGFRLDVTVAPEVPHHLAGDPGRIRQVLSLALRAMAPDLATPAARLAVERRREDADEVLLDFTISAPRAGAAGRPDAPAAGRTAARPAARPAPLHRLMAERLAAALGGELIEMDSAERAGWRLRVPLRKAGPRSAADAPEVSLRGRRVLVASASGALRVSLQIALRNLGCEPEVAEEGRAALRALRHAAARGVPFDVAIVDLLLHGMDGEQLGAATRGDDALRGTSLVMLTDVGSPGDADWALASGFAAYLVKPVKPKELRSVLARLIAARERRAGAGSAEGRDLVTRHTLREASRPALRALVVDDDRVNLLALRTALERMGHSVTTAESGHEGLERWSEGRFDVVLLDARLPDVDGDQVALTMRARERGRQEPRALILCMSSNQLPGDRERCLAAGADDFLRKPLDPTRIAHYLAGLARGAARLEASPLPDGLADLRASLEAALTPAGAEDPGARGARVLAPAPLDEARLDMASMGIASLRREMLETLVAEVGAGIARFETAVRSGDGGPVSLEADQLHSLCTSVGARRLASLLAPFASAGSSADLDALARALPALRMEEHRLRAYVEDTAEAA
uniref:Response regulator n=1 Tax=Eiseniibacteriota bacterium TaxID=2212470 RepID=A0A832MKH1_UNCEI